MTALEQETQLHPNETSTTDHERSFAETALRLGGKSAEEARRTGAVDAADDQVEAMFAPQYQTINSPLHRVVWDRRAPIDLFGAVTTETTPEVAKVMQDSLDVVQHHRRSRSLLDEHRKISSTVLRELSEAGYWGLLVGTEYGGSGAPFAFRH